MKSFLEQIEPMGIYQMLYAFLEASGSYMGDPGTHPWSQGFPLTSQLPGGPEMPKGVSVSATDLMYPKAQGNQPLREAIARYYRDTYGSKISYENVMVFAGGRGALFAVAFLLGKDVQVMIEETEYTPYYDLLQILGRTPILVPSNPENGFLPSVADYAALTPAGRHLRIRSNPCNPTGQVMRGAALQAFVDDSSKANAGALIDEAYEFFVDPEPVSALAHIKDINDTNIFVAGAATKGLQAPGIRVGWVVASKQNIETLGNYSTFAMGGVSRPSQLYAEALFEPKRAAHARKTVAEHYTAQRKRYGEALAKLDVELYTGPGGFYHWGRLPSGLTADVLNERLFRKRAAILPGRLCDMQRRGAASPLNSFFRFSFGPLPVESFKEDVAILTAAIRGE